MKYLKTILILLFLWIISHLTYTVDDGIKDDGHRADIAVILGNTVHEDGTLSTRLGKRLERGLELYKNKRVKQII